MKRYYFISGLPRSGSTLLSAILKQNPDFYADISSPVRVIVDGVIDSLSKTENNFTVHDNQRCNLIHGIFDGYYKNESFPIIFDSSRIWTARTNLIKNLFPYTKILCPVRDIVSILNSFEIIFSKNPYYKNTVLENNQTVFFRCNELMDTIIGSSLVSLKEGYASNPEMIHFIEYENLCKDPEKVVRKIYEFLEIPYYSHNFDNLEYTNGDFDTVCNLKDLHTVKRRVEYKPPRNILPPEIVQKHKRMNMEFWRENYKPNYNIIENLNEKFIDYN